jgi:hypothetical protein
MRPVHTLLSQSVPTRQLSPGVQVGQIVPPQSTSVSSWFWMPSTQVAAAVVVVLDEVDVVVLELVLVVEAIEVLVVVTLLVVVVGGPGRCRPRRSCRPVSHPCRPRSP